MSKKKSITINNKEYIMPKLEIDAYLDYLEVRDDVMGTEKKNGLYTRAQFVAMMEQIVALYGNQFTIEELKDKDTGLSVADIIMEFASIELAIGEDVNKKVGTMQENFTSGK